MKFFIACALAALADSILALHFPVTGRLSPRSTSLFRRGNYGSTLVNAQNLVYYAELTIGGGSFFAQVDTGRYVLNVCLNGNFLNVLVLTFGLPAISQSLMQQN
jgi:hypothetical protein